MKRTGATIDEKFDKTVRRTSLLHTLHIQPLPILSVEKGSQSSKSSSPSQRGSGRAKVPAPPVDGPREEDQREECEKRPHNNGENQGPHGQTPNVGHRQDAY